MLLACGDSHMITGHTLPAYTSDTMITGCSLLARTVVDSGCTICGGCALFISIDLVHTGTCVTVVETVKAVCSYVLIHMLDTMNLYLPFPTALSAFFACNFSIFTQYRGVSCRP